MRYVSRDLPAQRMLRLGSYVPDYLDEAKVHMSVNEPMDGFRRDKSLRGTTGASSTMGSTGVHYRLLPNYAETPRANV